MDKELLKRIEAMPVAAWDALFLEVAHRDPRMYILWQRAFAVQKLKKKDFENFESWPQMNKLNASRFRTILSKGMADSAESSTEIRSLIDSATK